MHYAEIIKGCNHANFSMKKMIFFVCFAQNIDCGYTVPTVYVLEQKKEEKMYTTLNPSFSIFKWCVRVVNYTDMLA